MVTVFLPNQKLIVEGTMILEIDQSDSVCDAILKIFDTAKPFYYTDIAGVTNALYPQYTKGCEHIYNILFKVFNKFSLDFYLFAGSIVGYVRDRQMPPWMDDLDVIIFENQIELFKEKIIPYLVAAGFEVFSPPDFVGGGYHILSLRLGPSRRMTIPYSSDTSVEIPWAQIDVFFTTIDQNGFLKNMGKWGLYTQKEIPHDWVVPGKEIDIFGAKAKIFNKYEEDIRKEYGDVHNNVIIETHGNVICKMMNIPYQEINKSYRKILETKMTLLPPSLSAEEIKNFSAEPDSRYVSKDSDNFDTILKSLVELNASTLTLSKGDHFFWAMDIKRVLPSISIEAVVHKIDDVSRATHFYKFYSNIVGENEDINKEIASQVDLLKSLNK
jgi:hypothetical protein